MLAIQTTAAQSIVDCTAMPGSVVVCGAVGDRAAYFSTTGVDENTAMTVDPLTSTGVSGPGNS